MANLNFILFLAFSSLSLAQNQELPVLPDHYSTKIQANIILTERGKIGPGAGISYAFDEAANGDEKAYLAYKVIDGWQMSGTVIWNPEIDGIDNFIDIVDFEGYFCYSDSFEHNQILGALFDATGTQFPSIAHMLHFGPEDGYVFTQPENVNGIPCNTFESKSVKVPALNGTFDVKYHWSNPDEWISTAGPNKSIPVMARVNGEYWFNEKWNKADMYFEFTDFKDDYNSHYLFQPPSDIWCDKRQMNNDLPGVPDFFSYTSEALFFYELPVEVNGRHLAVILSTRQEYYDYLQKVSRTDYRPIDLNYIIDPEHMHKPLYVNEIKDFSSGIMYSVWADYGNCSINWVGNDAKSDVTINDDGTISMTSPLEMFGMDKKFAYNGRGWKERGIDMDSYVTMEKLFSNDGKYEHDMTLALWLSGDFIQVEGEESNEYKIPVKIEKYPTDNYMDFKQRQMYNIIGFREGEPDFNLFDITPCFYDYQMSHRMIKTGWDAKFEISTGLKKARDQVRNAVRDAAKLSPIRVQNIELIEDAVEKSLYIIFTLVDFPRDSIVGVNATDLPEEVTIALPAAEEYLKTAIQSGTFKIELPLSGGGYGAVLAASDFFQEVDRTGGSTPNPINNNNDSGYSAGAMAGLGITMLILAFAGGVALLVYVFKW